MINFDMPEKCDLINDDTKPVNYAKRQVGMISLITLWVGMEVNLGAMMIAGQLYPTLSVGQVYVIIVLGMLTIGVILGCVQDMGLKYGIPFIVAIKASFGYRGAAIVGFFECIPLVFWLGINTWAGGEALSEISRMLFGVSNTLIGVLVFMAIQMYLCFYGIKLLKYCSWVATPILLVMCGYAYYSLVQQSGMSFGQVLTQGGTAFTFSNFPIFAAAFVAYVGAWVGVMEKMQDVTRDVYTSDAVSKSWWKSNFKYVIAQIIGLLPTGMLVNGLGVISNATTGNWNPIIMFSNVFGAKSTALAVAAQIFIVFALLSTNPVANMYGPAITISNFSKKRLSIRQAAFIFGIIAILIQPWSLINYLNNIITYFGSFMGPIFAISVVDYFIIRHREYTLEDLYWSKGKYRYDKGFSLAAIYSMLIGFGVGCILSSFMYFASILGAGIAYYFLMTKWYLKKHPEVADLPLPTVV
ncbi:cytosine permease [Anaerotruncus rubiinfantis]|uniref:cytosine permease n=2 Tax=Anaerotruncus rubiinfantis TaxID=1720200 RepID=UPI00189C0F24|nr:cytosine permease [Anaerotruncus rubiinfantis]